MITKTKVLNKNYQKTYYQLSTSTVVDKWVKEVTQPNNLQRTLKVQLILTPTQSNIIDEWINTCRYIYNKTLKKINNNEAKVNFMKLRTLLVTNKTKTLHPEYIKNINKKNKYLNKIKIIKTDLVEFNKLNIQKDNLTTKIINYEKLHLTFIDTNSINPCKIDKNIKTCVKKLNMVNIKLNNYNKYKINYKDINFKLKDKLLDEIIETQKLFKSGFAFNYKLYNLKKKIEKNKIQLKNIKKTIKSEQNKNVQKWELNTPKEIRAGAINDVCKAYKTCFSLLEKNQINYFNIKLKKKSNPKKCIAIPASLLKLIDKNTIQFAPEYFKNEKLVKIKTIKKQIIKRNEFYENLIINQDCRLIKHHHKYYLYIPIKKPISTEKKIENYCGIDHGVRTFMNVFSNNGYYEYQHNTKIIKKINNKI